MPRLSASLDVGAKVIGELARIGKVHRFTEDVQQAGFLVLKSPDMPSILVETAYISNPEEERKLRDRAHQGKLADAILAGVRKLLLHESTARHPHCVMDLRRDPVRQVRHVIARGDTLSEIAERYNVSASEIRTATSCPTIEIRVGQTLSTSRSTREPETRKDDSRPIGIGTFAGQFERMASGLSCSPLVMPMPIRNFPIT